MRVVSKNIKCGQIDYMRSILNMNNVWRVSVVWISNNTLNYIQEASNLQYNLMLGALLKYND